MCPGLPGGFTVSVAQSSAFAERTGCLLPFAALFAINYGHS
jgi:hypothetical protein